MLVEKSALHGMAIPEQVTPLLSPFTVSKISRAKGVSCLADITTDTCTKAKVALWKSCHWRATLTNFCSEGFFFKGEVGFFALGYIQTKPSKLTPFQFLLSIGERSGSLELQGVKEPLTLPHLQRKALADFNKVGGTNVSVCAHESH